MGPRKKKSSSEEAGPKYTRGHQFLERKRGGHKTFDDQNVGSHALSQDDHIYSVFDLFKNF